MGADQARIVGEASRLLADPSAYAEMARAVSPFGDGHASERIVAAIEAALPRKSVGERHAA